MFKAKKILFILLALSLVFAIVSCGGGTTTHTECVDEGGDGVCDVCNKKMSTEEVAEIPLFENGKPTFQIVVGKSEPDTVKLAITSSIQEMLKNKYDVDVLAFTEESEEDDETNIEILVGNVTSRGDDYIFDDHTLGKKGYSIKIIGSKVIIDGGSENAIIEAVELFAEKLFKNNDITDLAITDKDTVHEIQNDYKVTSLKVNGTDMKGYTIATELTRKHYKDVAEILQDMIYEDTGYWLDIVDIENSTDKSLIIKHVDGIVGEDSYKVTAKGTQLFIECSFDNYLERATAQFATQKISIARGDVDFKNTVYTQDVSVVYYDDFEAKGDGKTDDFFAIYNAHVFANESGQSVKASRNPKNKVYYIYDTRVDPVHLNNTVSIPIQTNTDWQGVKFIIDDHNIPTYKVSGDPDHTARWEIGQTNIFKIIPNEEHEGFNFEDKTVIDKIVADGLNPDTTHIDLKIEGWDGALMLVPYNSEHGVFRRRGEYTTLQSVGEAMHELIIIDKDGNVSEETPIMFEYTNIDYIMVYKLDPSTAITVGNATIETIEARVENVKFDENGKKDVKSTGYIRRGINVSRSYTTVENITHILSGGYTLKERANGNESSNYNGMFRASYCNRVTFKNCIMPGRQQYGGHSSYNFGALCVNKIVVDGCIQSNFWISVDANEGVMYPSTDYVDGAVPSMSSVKVYDDNGNLVSVPMCWGIGGTNYCKNMEYINSQLSRFDAHQGLYNAKIINSKINAMELTGYGELVLENVDWYQYWLNQKLLALRSDYGYLWNGSISVKDTRAHLYDIGTGTPSLTLVGHKYTNFYYGYQTAFPNVAIDNLDVYSTKKQAPVEAGYKISVYDFESGAKQMHLVGNAGKYAIFTYVDTDKDGYIDEPLLDINFDGRIDDKDKIDIDGDGRVGNTNLSYASYKGQPMTTLNKGITHLTCKTNLNTIRPPEYIKIINNDGVDGKGGYVYTVVNTAGQNISDGGWYRDADAPDTMGGFFGNTKFIYGLGKDEYFHGTDYVDQNLTTTFKFFN